jgi:ABC-type sugar transport system ATPase subunit
VGTSLDSVPVEQARLVVEAVTKTFPGVTALSEINLDIRPGEVHALVGPNGSGKSTFVKILSGFLAPDPGAQAWLHGRHVPVNELSQQSSERTRELAFVHQDLGLVLQLTALDNFALHTAFARTRWGAFDRAKQRRRAEQLLEPLGARIDLDAPMANATPIDRTMVAIAIALQGWRPETGIFVLDEPTASLPYHEVQRLFAVLDSLRDRGAGILYVSHRLEEVFQLADRVTVFRNGRLIETVAVAKITKRDLVAAMVGTPSSDEAAHSATSAHSTYALELRNAAGLTLRDASFELCSGEILGIVGLPGSGSDELPRLISDRSRQATGGWFRMGDQAWKPLRRIGIRDVALVPPDRANEGIIPSMSVLENLTIMELGNLSIGPWLVGRRTQRFTAEWIQKLGIVTQGGDTRIENLSGGNQQKVVIGRALSRNPSVLVLCEPTAGVDVGARRSIYGLIKEQVQRGLAVIVSSADLEDIVALCDRVIVLRDGRISARLTAADVTEKRLVEAMEGEYGQ